MKDFLLCLWQLPQNLLGLFCIMFYKPIIKYYYEDDKGHKFVVYGQRNTGKSFSLGKYLFCFCDKEGAIRETTLYHEYGHTFQSRRLGWLYLIVVGAYSGIRCWLHSGDGYYDHYPEKQADKYGNIKYKENSTIRYVEKRTLTKLRTSYFHNDGS